MKKSVDPMKKYIDIAIGVAVVAVLAIVASIVYLSYYSTLHIDANDITAIYGRNDFKGAKYEFDDKTAAVVRDSLAEMKHDGADRGNMDIYQTYICLEMSNGKKLIMKYCDADHVYVTQGAVRKGRYTCPTDLLRVASALENKYGFGDHSLFDEETDLTDTDMSSEVQEDE